MPKSITSKPADDKLVAAMLTTYAEMEEHDHPPSPQADIFCENLTAWLGERTPALLARLHDAELKVDQMRPVFEKALAWANGDDIRTVGFDEVGQELFEAVRAAQRGEAPLVDEYCEYGYPVGGRQPRIDWCGLEHGHDGLHCGADGRGFADSSAIRRGRILR